MVYGTWEDQAIEATPLDARLVLPKNQFGSYRVAPACQAITASRRAGKTAAMASGFAEAVASVPDGVRI